MIIQNSRTEMESTDKSKEAKVERNLQPYVFGSIPT